MVFDFIEGAAGDEVTHQRNETAFDDWEFSPRVLINVEHVDQTVSVFGQSMAAPLVLGPTGLCGLAAPRGEILAARAAGHAGRFSCSGVWRVV
jgi:L-lactate dehydrogenase (cytochrome)